MKEKPLVTIIIPAYNAEKYISSAINSVINQTYENLELLIIDDGSTDGTDEISRRYYKDYDNIKYYKKENGGVSSARNYGIQKSKGDYICFLDSDDLLPKDSIFMLLESIEENDAVFGPFAYLYDNKIILKKSRVRKGSYSYEELKNRLVDDGTLSGMLFGSVCGALYSSSIIKHNRLQFDEKVKVNEDGLFNLEFLHKSSMINVINEKYVYIYRQWKSSKTANISRNACIDEATEEIIKFIDTIGDADSYRSQLNCRTVSVAFWNALSIKDSNAGYLKSRRFLKELFNDDSFKLAKSYMKPKRMNIYKRLLYYSMEFRLYFIFYITIRNIAPLLKNKLQR